MHNCRKVLKLTNVSTKGCTKKIYMKSQTNKLLAQWSVSFHITVG